VSESPDIKTQVTTLLDAVKALAMAWKDKLIARARPKAKSAGIMGGSFGAAGYMAINALSLLFLAGAAGFGALWYKVLGVFGAAALGLVSMAIVLLILAAVLALVGRAQLPELKKPVAIADDVKAAQETVKAGIEKGKAEVAAELEGTPSPELGIR